MSEKKVKLFHTCRACLSLSTGQFLISENISQINTNAQIMFNYFLIEIAEDDYLPKTICSPCLNKLQAAYNFFRIFKHSQQLLQSDKLTKIEDEKVTVDYNELNTNVEGESSEANNMYESTDSISNKGEEETESFIITCDENEFEGNDSDDQDYLIQQSVKLTEEYMQAFGNDYDENSREVEDIDNQDSNEEHQNDKPKSPQLAVFHCPLCPKTFRTFNIFSNHLSQHNSEITCQACSLQFDDVDFYLEHYQNHHNYQCNICQKAFQRADTYNRHIQAHNNALPQFACPYDNCPKSFNVKQSLRNHCITKHSEKRNYLCNICGTSFKNYDNLRYHIKKHKGPSHLCNTCGKGFMQAGHLKYHMWKHTGFKPHKCTKCERSFVSRKVLTKHIERNCSRRRKIQKVI